MLYFHSCAVIHFHGAVDTITNCRTHNLSLRAKIIKVMFTPMKVTRMQRSGTEAIRTLIKPKQTKRKIIKIQIVKIQREYMVNRVSSYFQKRWPLSNQDRTKNNTNTRKVKRHQNSDTKTGIRKPQQNYRLGTVSNEVLKGLKLVLRAQPNPQFLKWYKTFSWLFGSHDNLLTRQ